MTKEAPQKGFDHYCLGCERNMHFSRHRNKKPEIILCERCRKALRAHITMNENKELCTVPVQIPYQPKVPQNTNRWDVENLLVSVLTQCGLSQPNYHCISAPTGAPIEELCQAIAAYAATERQAAKNAADHILVRLASGEALLSHYEAKK